MIQRCGQAKKPCALAESYWFGLRTTIPSTSPSPRRTRSYYSRHQSGPPRGLRDANYDAACTPPVRHGAAPTSRFPGRKAGAARIIIITFFRPRKARRAGGVSEQDARQRAPQISQLGALVQLIRATVLPGSDLPRPRRRQQHDFTAGAPPARGRAGWAGTLLVELIYVAEAQFEAEVAVSFTSFFLPSTPVGMGAAFGNPAGGAGGV